MMMHSIIPVLGEDIVTSVFFSGNPSFSTLIVQNGFEESKLADVIYFGPSSDIKSREWVEQKRATTQPHKQAYLDEIEARRPFVEESQRIENSLFKYFGERLAVLINLPEDGITPALNAARIYSFENISMTGTQIRVYKKSPNDKKRVFCDIQLAINLSSKGVRFRCAFNNRITTVLPSLLTELVEIEKNLRAQPPQAGHQPTPG